MSSFAKRVLLVLVAGLAGVACVEDLPKQTDIERMRLLGLATYVGEQGADEATPEPGDTLFLELFVVFPTGQPSDDVRVSWFACATVPLATPLDACDQSTFTVLGMNGPPTTSLQVPTTAGSDGLPPESLVVFGIACDGADLTLPSGPLGTDLITQVRCDGARDQELFTTTIPVRCGEAAEGEEPVGCQRNASNTRPPVLDVTLDGQPWTAETPMPIDTREVHPAKYVLGVSVPSADAFESYSFRPYESPARETRNEEILVTFGSDGGRLEAPYRVLSSEQIREDLEWATPRAETVPESREVRLYIVTRDDRGGMRMQTLLANVR